MSKPLTDDDLVRTVEAIEANGGFIARAAKSLGIGPSQVQNRFKKARQTGLRSKAFERRRIGSGRSICDVEGCKGKMFASGLCKLHYDRRWRAQTTEGMSLPEACMVCGKVRMLPISRNANPFGVSLCVQCGKTQTGKRLRAETNDLRKCLQTLMEFVESGGELGKVSACAWCNFTEIRARIDKLLAFTETTSISSCLEEVMKMAKAKAVEPWVANLAKAREYDQKAGGELYERVSLLVKVYGDPGFRERHAGLDDLRLAARLDRELSEVFVGFLALKALLEYCPDKSRWEKESLRGLYQEMAQRRKRSPESASINGNGKANPHGSKSPSSHSEMAEWQEKCRAAQEENIRLQRKLAAADQEIAALREQVAELQEQQLVDA